MHNRSNMAEFLVEGVDEAGKPTSKQSNSILLVEDEGAVRERLPISIAKKYPDAVIFSAGDGRSGLESFLLHTPDIIITDISMPIMDGICMAAKIKWLKPDAVIIAVTTHTDTNDLPKAIEIGIDRYLLKPLRMKRLYTLIDKVTISKVEIMNRKHVEETLRQNEERHKNE